MVFLYNYIKILHRHSVYKLHFESYLTGILGNFLFFYMSSKVFQRIINALDCIEMQVDMYLHNDKMAVLLTILKKGYNELKQIPTFDRLVNLKKRLVNC